MVILAAILAVTGLQPIQSPSSIDFEASAATLDQVLTKLSIQSGSRLRAAPIIAKELIFIHVKGVRLDDLKARIAEAAKATWEKREDAEYLIRSPEVARAIKTEHLAYRRKLVDEGLGQARRSLETPFNAMALASGLATLPSRNETRNDPVAAQSAYNRERDLFAQGPRARLLNRLILACHPDDLAAIGPHERAIFTATPTPMQRGFDSKKLRQAFELFGAEQTAWIEEAAKAAFPQDPEGRMVSDPRTQLRPGPTIDGFALEVRRGEMTALFNVNLIGRTPGNVLTQASFADSARNFLNAQMTPTAPNPNDPVVEFSGDALEFARTAKEAFSSRLSPQLSKRMREMALGVEVNDPLSWTVSDALHAYARSKSVNLVVSPPDSMLSIAMFVSQAQPLRAGAFMKALVESATLAKTEREGWEVYVPADRYESMIDFTPRAATATLVREALAENAFDIQDYATYAFRSKRLNRGGLGDLFLAMIDRSYLGASDRTDWDSLRLYGSLSEQKRRELEAGARIPFAGMTEEQRSIVHRIAFQREIRSERQTGEGSISSSSPIEPTIAFPNGVPSGSTVGARVTTNPVLVAYGRDADGTLKPLRAIDEFTLASYEVDSAGDPQLKERYGLAGLTGFALGNHRLIALKVEFAPSIWRESLITVSDYPRDANPVAWNALPEPYRKRIYDAIEQVKARNAAPPTRSIPPQRGRSNHVR